MEARAVVWAVAGSTHLQDARDCITKARGRLAVMGSDLLNDQDRMKLYVMEADLVKICERLADRIGE